MNQPVDPEPHTWTVERWGGQPRHKERVLLRDTEEACRKEFTRLAAGICQGTLRLRRPNGVTELLATSTGTR